MSSRTSDTGRAAIGSGDFSCRTACVVIRSFEIQEILRRRPDWREFPVAWVSAQKPTAKLLEVNSLAGCSGLRPGMQYSVALSVVPELRADCL